MEGLYLKAGKCGLSRFEVGLICPVVLRGFPGVSGDV